MEKIIKFSSVIILCVVVQWMICWQWLLQLLLWPHAMGPGSRGPHTHPAAGSTTPAVAICMHAHFASQGSKKGRLWRFFFSKGFGGYLARQARVNAKDKARKSKEARKGDRGRMCRKLQWFLACDGDSQSQSQKSCDFRSRIIGCVIARAFFSRGASEISLKSRVSSAEFSRI